MDTSDTPAGHADTDDVAVQLADGPVSAPATPPAPAPDAAEATEEEQARHGEGARVGVVRADQHASVLARRGRFQARRHGRVVGGLC